MREFTTDHRAMTAPEPAASPPRARRLRVGGALLAAGAALLVLHIFLAYPSHRALAEGAQDGSGTVAIVPAAASVNEGELVTVSVWLTEAVDTYGLDVRLSFDPQVVSATALVPRWDLFDEHNHLIVKEEWDNDAGTIWYAISNQNPAEPFTGTGAVCALVFQGTQVGTSPLTITYARGSTRDGEPITPTRESGSITVGHGVITATTSLTVGWHLVSEPLIPTSTVITHVLSSVEGSYDLVYAYDREQGEGTWRIYDPERPSFLNDLTDIDRTMGFWIRMTEPLSLTVEGTRPISTHIPLTTGWNLVGYPSEVTRPVTEALESIDGMYDLVYAYHAEDGDQAWKVYDVDRPPFLNSLTAIEPWRGLWIRATEDCVLSVDYD